MRQTKQKSIIFTELQKHLDHPTADEIYMEVRKILPRISLGTVYRNLELLSMQGKILKMESGGSFKRFDPNIKPHAHFRCIICNKVEDIPEEIEPKIPTLKNTEWAESRKVTSTVLDYSGICPECINKDSENHN